MTMGGVEPAGTRRTGSGRAKLVLSAPPRWHGLAEVSIRVLALTAIAAVVLIFAFVAREALPLLFSDEVHKEVTLRKMWTAQQWPGYDAPDHIWQPVSEIPKYGVWPLMVGTLKVTLVAMLFGVPLGVGAALYVSQVCPTARA